jgi:hypothetical protein
MLKYYAWFLFLVLNPFYWFPSGNPQVSDFLMVALLLFSGASIKMGYKYAPFNKNALTGFLVYTFIANFILWIVHFTNYRGIPMISSVFYTYNALVLFFVIGLALKNSAKFVEWTQKGIFWSVSLQIAYFVLFGAKNFDQLRPSFFFSTPNQLGYYALLMLSIYLLLNKLRRTKLVYFVVIFLSCLFMTLISASKAAVGGALFLSVFYLFDNQVLKGYGLIAVAVIVSLSYYFVFKNDKGVKQATYVQERIEQGSKENQVSEWEYRGYDRMNNHPYYLFLGSGEGMYTRFKTYIKKHEMHSTFGNILFSYGIPGFTMFLMFFFSIFKGLKWQSWLYIIPVMLYSFTHMGARFTPFWILLAIFPIIFLILVSVKQKKLEDIKS